MPCHAPTTYTYQLKHVKTTACAHGHIPTWTKVLKLETCLCPGFPTTLWRMIRHFSLFFVWSFASSNSLRGRMVEPRQPQKMVGVGVRDSPKFSKWYPNELGVPLFNFSQIKMALVNLFWFMHAWKSSCGHVGGHLNQCRFEIRHRYAAMIHAILVQTIAQHDPL